MRCIREYALEIADIRSLFSAQNEEIRATITHRVIVARQSTRQFTQRDTHSQNVYIVTMRAGDG